MAQQLPTPVDADYFAFEVTVTPEQVDKNTQAFWLEGNGSLTLGTRNGTEYYPKMKINSGTMITATNTMGLEWDGVLSTPQIIQKPRVNEIKTSDNISVIEVFDTYVMRTDDIELFFDPAIDAAFFVNANENQTLYMATNIHGEWVVDPENTCVVKNKICILSIDGSTSKLAVVKAQKDDCDLPSAIENGRVIRHECRVECRRGYGLGDDMTCEKMLESAQKPTTKTPELLIEKKSGVVDNSDISLNNGTLERSTEIKGFRGSKYGNQAESFRAKKEAVESAKENPKTITNGRRSFFARTAKSETKVLSESVTQDTDESLVERVNTANSREMQPEDFGPRLSHAGSSEMTKKAAILLAVILASGFFLLRRRT